MAAETGIGALVAKWGGLALGACGLVGTWIGLGVRAGRKRVILEGRVDTLNDAVCNPETGVLTRVRDLEEQSRKLQHTKGNLQQQIAAILDASRRCQERRESVETRIFEKLDDLSEKVGQVVGYIEARRNGGGHG
jgi:hypothetical protein